MNTLRHILICARYLLVRQIRARVYVAIFAAAIALSFASIVLEELAGGEGGRIVFDIGSFAVMLTVSILALVLGVLSNGRVLRVDGVSLLSRPVARSVWVVGSFVSGAAIIVGTAAILGAIGTGYLVVSGGKSPGLFLAAAMSSALGATTFLAMVIGFGAWLSEGASTAVGVLYFLAGNFIGEADILIRKNILGALSTPIVRIVQAIVIDQRRFDLGGLYHAQTSVPVDALAWTLASAILFCGAGLLLGSAGLRRRQL